MRSFPMRLALGSLLCLIALGCGSGAARVKGRVVENGTPLQLEPGTQVSLKLSPIGTDDKPDPAKFYTAMLNADGTFEITVSGGELAPGKYQVSLDAFAAGKMKTKLKPFALTGSKLRTELKAGSNDITVDLAKPEG